VGSFRGPAIQGKVEGSQLKIITVIDSVVDLGRAGDSVLTGDFRRKDGAGGVMSASLTKEPVSTEFDGDWVGIATAQSVNCAAGSYALTVENSTVTGTVDFPSYSTSASHRLSAVTGDIRADKTARLTLRANSTDGRSSSFTGTFSNNEFKGTDQGRGGCSYEVWLKKK